MVGDGALDVPFTEFLFRLSFKMEPSQTVQFLRR